MRPAVSSFVLLAVLLVSSLGNAATEAASVQLPWASDLLAVFRDRLSSTSLDDTERVRLTVDTYFRLKAEGWVRLQAPDLAPVMESGESLSYEQGRLAYSIECWRQVGHVHGSCEYRPKYRSIAFDGDSCLVSICPIVWLRGAVRYQVGAELHEILLVRSHDGWKIREDRYEDEFTDMYPRGTDFQQLLVALPSELAGFRDREKEIELQLASDPRSNSDWTPDMPGVMATYVSYDRTRAAQYGTTYTNNDGSLYTTTGYNPLFKSYNPSDCQNFVCQCIWYGFGGINDYAHISAHLFPMVGNGGPLGTWSWWSDGASTVYLPGQTYDWPWVNVSDFYGIAQDQYLNDKIGVQATLATSSTVYKGDYVATAGWSHVLIIVNCIDANGNRVYDYSEIWVSAHTSNRRNVPLASLYPSPSSVVFVRVVRYRDS